ELPAQPRGGRPAPGGSVRHGQVLGTPAGMCQPGGLRALPVRPAGRRTPLRGHAERDLAALGNRLRATRAVRRGQRTRATASTGKPLRSGKRTFLGGNTEVHGAGKGGPAGSTRRSTALSRRRSWARARATGSWAPDAPTPDIGRAAPDRKSVV